MPTAGFTPPSKLDAASELRLLRCRGFSLALLDSAEHFMNEMRYYVSIHSRPIRRLTPQPTERGRADCPSLKGGVTKKDFIGSAVLSTSLFPLKVEVSNHKEIFDEEERFVMTSKLSTGPVRGAASS